MEDSEPESGRPRGYNTYVAPVCIAFHGFIIVVPLHASHLARSL